LHHTQIAYTFRYTTFDTVVYAYSLVEKQCNGHGFDSETMHELVKCIPWMQCRWLCLNLNQNCIKPHKCKLKKTKLFVLCLIVSLMAEADGLLKIAQFISLCSI